MRFISGMIIGEINGIALGIAGCVVAVAISMIVDKEGREYRKYKYRPGFSTTNYSYQNYAQKSGDQNEDS